MKDTHKVPIVGVRLNQADRDWLVQEANDKGLPMNQIIKQALDMYRFNTQSSNTK